MSSLATRFAVKMRKRATNDQGEATPGSEGPGGKRSRRSDLKEETQKSPTVIDVDSPERAPDDLLAMRGFAQGALNEASITLEDLAPVGGSPNADQVLGEAHSEAATDRAFLARLAMAGPRMARMVDRMVLSSYVQPMEWDHPSVDAPVPGLETTQSIIG